MTNRREQLKLEVTAAVIEHMRRSGLKGEDREIDAYKAFPGIPGDVVINASMALGNEETEAFWDQLEKTIDGEILRKALIGENRL